MTAIRLFNYLCLVPLSVQGFTQGPGKDMVLVQGGSFELGNPREHHSLYLDERPVHWVQLSDFYINKYEITNEDYAFFLNELHEGWQLDSVDRVGSSTVGIRFENDIFIDVLTKADSSLNAGIVITANNSKLQFRVSQGRSQWPVTFVTWYGARAYCQWKYENGGLPTEAQWEYAARGGRKGSSDFNRYAGGNDLDQLGWYWENADFHPHDVGTKSPNELGLFDFSGNLWEWVADHWHDNYQGAPSNGSAWIDPSSRKDEPRVLRGGAWLYSEGEATVTNRWADVPDDRHDYKGFRCACQK